MRSPDHLEQELQAVVSCPTWTLGAKFSPLQMAGTVSLSWRDVSEVHTCVAHMEN